MKKFKVGKNRLDASFIRNTFDESSRTVDIIFATGSPVKRSSYFEGDYIEQLSMKKSHVRLDRLNAGAPVLNNHRNNDLNDIIGVVESASIKDGQGLATVKLSSRADVSGLVEDIKDGVIKNISVGYRVHAMKEEKTKGEDDIPVFTAIDWEPLELSFVTIPADAAAQVRGEDNKQDYDEVIVEEQENEMGKKTTGKVETRTEQTSDSETVTEEVAKVAAPAETVSEETAIEEAVTAEEVVQDGTETLQEEARKADDVQTQTVDDKEVRAAERVRIESIRSLVKESKLDDKFAGELINNETSVDEARKLIIKRMETETEKNKTFNHNLEVNDVDNKNLRNEARVRSLLHRFDSSKHKLQDGDRQFAGGSIIDMAREYLASEMQVRDVLTMSKTEVAKRALHHSSDFPEVLANTANKALRESYESTPNTFMPFTKEVSRSDFKEGSSIMLSDGGKLEKVNEHGEYKRGSVSESAEKYKVEKFGKIIGHTWELMVNDDLDAFTKIPSRLGVRAREKENELMWELITSNAAAGQLMAETGFNLFNLANHGNVGTASAISIASLGQARKAMRLHKDLDGELISGLAPKYLFVPASLETVADQFVSQITPNENGQVNPFANRVQVVVEPRLDGASATGWYMMADKSMIDMAEIARLDGRGPEIFTREGFDVDGMEVKIRYVFGVKIIDYRGFFRNAGV